MKKRTHHRVSGNRDPDAVRRVQLVEQAVHRLHRGQAQRLQPCRRTSGKIDPVNLIIIVANGTDEQIFDVPESGFEAGHKLEWINARIPLTGATVNEETRITIRQTQWPASTANRWFLDNIKIVEK